MTYLGQRRPVVATNDLLMCTAALICCLFVSGWVLLYLLVVALMFGVSCMHHWLPYAKWHHKLDRATIYLLIAATPLPYTEIILAQGKVGWLIALWVSAGIGVLLKVFGWGVFKGVIPTILYCAVGLLSVVNMSTVHQYLGLVWAAWFWFGVLLYVVQMLNYNLSWPNPYPEYESYRWFQHFVLDNPPIIHTTLAILFVM